MDQQGLNKKQTKKTNYYYYYYLSTSRDKLDMKVVKGKKKGRN